MSPVLITIITSTITLLIGIFLNRIFESKSRLITYYGHVGAGKIKIEQENKFIDIFTHSIVVRNVGRKSATNVRIGHNPLVLNIENMISVYPPTETKVLKIANVGEEIVLERLLPSQEVMITYVYAPPLQFDRINSYVRSDEGFAKRVHVLLNRQWPLWFLNILRILLFIGFVASIYGFYLFAEKLMTCFGCHG
ncbi:MAG TPA: hypothetical protein VFU82_01315 [Gammaproteobacteria bacterium]|nr:hypothetical protein [Gammaproteobacteria bacterium]